MLPGTGSQNMISVLWSAARNSAFNLSSWIPSNQSSSTELNKREPN